MASWGPDTDQRMIAIAISDVVYHLDMGYIAYANVYNKLVEVWAQGVSSPTDGKLKENGTSSKILNDAITEAASLGPQILGYFDKPGSFVTGVYNDVGFSDFVATAFRLFGLKFESIYYLFFVEISASALLFVFSFRRHPAAYAVVAFALFSFFLEMYSTIFVSGATPTFAGPRHGSVLALIPAWHFIFLLYYRVRPSLLTVGAAVLQLLLMAHAIDNRSGGFAFVLAVLGVAIILALVRWWKLAKPNRNALQLFGAFAKWPILVLVLGLVVHAQHQSSKVNLVYLSDDAMAYHDPWLVTWESILLYAPEYCGLTKEQLAIPAGDGWAFWIALQYMREHHFLQSPEDNSVPPPTFMSQWIPHVKYRLMSNVMKRVVMDILMEHPVAIAHAYFVKKPPEIAKSLFKALNHVPWHIWIVGLALASLLAVLGYAGGVTTGAALSVTAMGLVAAVMTTAPSMWAFANLTTNAEAVVSVFTFVLLCAWTAVLFAILRWAGRRRLADDA